VPRTPVMTFRALPEMQNALRRIAQRDNRSMSSLIELAVRQLLERDEAAARKAPVRKKGR
jgi:predicted transcriptional regulator